MQRRVSESPEYSWGWVFHQEDRPHLPRRCTGAALAALEGLNQLLPQAPRSSALRAIPPPERPAAAFLALAHAAGCPEVHDILFNAYRDASTDGLAPQAAIPFFDLIAVSSALEQSALLYSEPLPLPERRRVFAALDRLAIGRIDRS